MTRRTAYALVLYMMLYLSVALISTHNLALFAGDSAAHMVQADYVKEHLSQVFGWSSISYAGYPLFFYYQPLPHILLALAFFLGQTILVYRVAIIFLYTLVPIAFYLSIRRMGFKNSTALIGALIPLMLSSYNGFGIEPNSIFGWGLFTQLFATVLFPLTVSQLYLFIRTGRGHALGVLLLSITLLSHPVIGSISALAGGITVLTEPLQFKKRLLNGIKILLFTVIVISFWLVPILSHIALYGGVRTHDYYYATPLQGLYLLLSGGVLDAFKPLPIFTLTSLGGIMLLLYVFFRAITAKKELDEKTGFILCGMVIFFLLFTAGDLFNRPVISIFELSRFLFGLHFFLLLASAAFLSRIHEQWRRAGTVIVVLIFAAGAVMTLFSANDRQSVINKTSDWPGLKDVADALQPYPDGRALIEYTNFEAGKALFYYYSRKPLLEGFSLGYQDSPVTQYIRNIKLSQSDLEKLNVKYIIGNASLKLSYPKQTYGSWVVYFINTSGYFYLSENCGKIIGEERHGEDYSVHLSLEKDCPVLFKMSFSPQWNARASGNSSLTSISPLRTTMTQEGLTSIDAGKHVTSINMKYRDVWYRKWLLVIGILTLIALFMARRKIE